MRALFIGGPKDGETHGFNRPMHEIKVALSRPITNPFEEHRALLGFDTISYTPVFHVIDDLWIYAPASMKENDVVRLLADGYRKPKDQSG